jgi:hypothetical protein
LASATTGFKTRIATLCLSRIDMLDRLYEQSHTSCPIFHVESLLHSAVITLTRQDYNRLEYGNEHFFKVFSATKLLLLTSLTDFAMPVQYGLVNFEFGEEFLLFANATNFIDRDDTPTFQLRPFNQLF